MITKKKLTPEEKPSVSRYTRIDFLDELLDEQAWRNQHYPTPTIIHHPNGKCYRVTVEEQITDETPKQAFVPMNGNVCVYLAPVVDSNPAEQYITVPVKDRNGDYIRDENGALTFKKMLQKDFLTQLNDKEE